MVFLKSSGPGPEYLNLNKILEKVIRRNTPQFKNFVATLFFNILAKKTEFGRVYKPKQEFR